MNPIDENEWNTISTPKGDDLNAKSVFYNLTDKLIIARDSLGYRHLLITLISDSPLLITQQNRGIKISKKILTLLNGEPKSYLDLQCTDPVGHHIFNSIGGEIAVGLSEMIEGEDTINSVTEILAKWKRFWGAQFQDILSFEEQVGLFGEVYFLRYWLLPKFGKNVVLSWEGPNGGRHDFVLADKSFEVKTSSSSSGHVHRINGFTQLANPQSGILYLFSLWLREVEDSAMTLNLVIEECKNYLLDDQEILSTFSSLLEKCGYFEFQKEEYQKRKMEIVSAELFRVDAKFPRITLDSLKISLPQEVEQIIYSLNLNTFLNNSICHSSTEFLTLEN